MKKTEKLFFKKQQSSVIVRQGLTTNHKTFKKKTGGRVRAAG